MHLLQNPIPAYLRDTRDPRGFSLSCAVGLLLMAGGWAWIARYDVPTLRDRWTLGSCAAGELAGLLYGLLLAWRNYRAERQS